MKIMSITLAGFLLIGCAGHNPLNLAASNPQQVISMAAEAAPQSVFASVAMQVRAVGTQKDVTYLNSEADYRDQRNVSIAIAPAAREKVEAVFGGDLEKIAVGKKIVVTGRAQRMKIRFFDNDGKPTDKYYYQTHVSVSDPAQIQII